ncbi:MAG: glycosyltransferase [Paludibacteraceae bacterium]|nr:glycosyltransferase [Paludibacteraceae bacterium]
MLSVIICTYNRDKYIGNLLESIAANDLDKSHYEIILVDNNCTDHTAEVCRRFSDTHPDVAFRYCVETEQGLSAARNKGINEATGDLLLYVDDDALVDTWYLRTATEFMETHPEVMACGGPILPLYETEEPKWMSPYTKALLTAWMDYGKVVRQYPNGKFPGGGNAAYRATVFQKVGLFNTELGRKGLNLMGSEEKDIFDKMTALGMIFYYLPDMILHHIIPQKKLEQDYFDRLTTQIGISERKRTLAISRAKYGKRLFMEAVKWGGTLVLWLKYLILLKPSKGNKLIAFRIRVSKGLLGLV